MFTNQGNRLKSAVQLTPNRATTTWGKGRRSISGARRGVKYGCGLLASISTARVDHPVGPLISRVVGPPGRRPSTASSGTKSSWPRAMTTAGRATAIWRRGSERLPYAGPCARCRPRAAVAGRAAIQSESHLVSCQLNRRLDVFHPSDQDTCLICWEERMPRSSGAQTNEVTDDARPSFGNCGSGGQPGRARSCRHAAGLRPKTPSLSLASGCKPASIT
jgi:hypothetical protein